MKDDLDKLLKSARVPERSPGYWEYFPKRVTAQVGEARAGATAPVRHHWLWLTGLATACAVLVAGILVGRLCESANSPHRLAEAAYTGGAYARLYREIEGLFPNQVQAIVVDPRGVKLVLSETPNVTRSQPLLIQACRRDDCRHVITFSGQQVKVNGDTWDVLVNGQNQVVVAGRSTDRDRIEAQQLREPGINHGDTEARSL